LRFLNPYYFKRQNMKKIKLTILSAVLSLVFIQFAEAQHVDNSLIINDAAKARIDSTLKSLVEENSLAGVSALIFDKNKEVYFNAFDYADREAKTKMDRSTVVRIYSMTKPITGTALMQVYEKGAFDLDDPLSKYAPEFANMQVFAG